jgi:large subunit ribosomal protein L30
MSKVKVTLKKSLIGSTEQQKSAVYSLGLKKIGQSVEVNLNPVIEGQINKVRHLIALEGNNIERK